MGKKQKHNNTKGKKVGFLKRKNQAIVKKVKQWQSFKYVNKLTCQNPDCDGILEPREQKSKVILVCPKCKYIQPYVPKPVIESNLEFPDKLLKGQQRVTTASKTTLASSD